MVPRAHPQVVQGVTTFYYLTGLFREGLTLIENALTRAEKIPTAPPQLLIHLRLARARFLERLAQYEDASRVLAALLTEPQCDELVRARARLRVGWISYWTGKLEQGRAVLREVVEWARTQQQDALEADALYVAGLVEQSAADIRRARAFYERALELYRANHNRYGESSALVNLADIGVDSTRFDDALRHGQAALALATQIGKRFDQAAANIILGSIYSALGQFTRATPHYAAALRLFREMGNATGESIALRDFAMLAIQRGNASNALGYAQDAARVSHQVGSAYREGMARTVMGNAYAALGDFSRAEACYEHAIELLQKAERGHRALDARAGLVRMAQQRDDLDALRQRVDELFAAFDAQNFHDSENPSAVYLVLYHALAAYDPPRAREILERGVAELNERAAHIQDDALRHEFLQNNSAARELRREYERALANRA